MIPVFQDLILIRFQCDEGRPSCRRCIQGGELCIGYRDEFSLVFRNENEKAARKSARRRASTQSLSSSGTSSQTSRSSATASSVLGADDPSDLSAAQLFGLNLSSPFPWAKIVPQASAPSAEDQAVSTFFEKYVMYPCNSGSSPGFLEQLPGLFEEVRSEGKLALRWAVRAAAYATISNDQRSATLHDKALQCYGLALSALGEALADPRSIPDDYMLMTVVVLDLFETIFLHDTVSAGSHAEGMAQILRLRGPDQIYGARGWSLFRVSHHRLQKQQLISRQAILPESEVWLNSLNEELPHIRVEKDTFQINKICERARNLLKSIKDTKSPADEILDMVKQMHDLDQIAETWRQGPEWAYKTVHRSQISEDELVTYEFPKFIQLHHDVWIAYEWNYHRTARIILHKHLMDCLDRLQFLQEPFQSDLCSLKQASVDTVQTLVDEVLSTVPQSLGDIDRNGNIMEIWSDTPKSKAVGGYFLLWPIKVILATRYATVEQITAARGVFERIRSITGMKSALGERSKFENLDFKI